MSFGTIDWGAVARRLGYASERAMWTRLYCEEGHGVIALAARFGTGHRPITSRLTALGIVRHPRGGQIVDDGLALKLFEKGLSYFEIAVKLGVSPGWVSKRIWKERERRAQASPEPTTPESTP